MGDIRPDARVEDIVPAYARGGASAVSVLVDERFGGTIDDLRAARAVTELPLLAKGFFSTEEHLRELREAGADAALLILRDLDDETARALMRYADELGLDTLVEAHDAEELHRATRLGATSSASTRATSRTFAIDRDAQLGSWRALRATAWWSPRAPSTRARRPPQPSSPAPTRCSSAPR